MLADSVVLKRVASDLFSVLDVKVLETKLETVSELNKIFHALV